MLFYLNKFHSCLEAQKNVTEVFCEKVFWKVLWNSRSSQRRCSIKKVFLQIPQNSQEITGARVSFLIKLQFYEKRDSGAVVFLWILRNLQEGSFYRTPLGDCFWNSQKTVIQKNCFEYLNKSLMMDSFLVKFWADSSNVTKKDSITSFSREIFFVKVCRTYFLQTISAWFIHNILRQLVIPVRLIAMAFSNSKLQKLAKHKYYELLFVQQIFEDCNYISPE